MKENEILLNIDNKEIFIEILNHSIDFLIGNYDEQQTMRMAHKYGFHNPDDFLLTSRTIAKIYRNICSNDKYESSTQDSDVIKSELINLSPEFQKIVLSALHSRHKEVIRSLIREQNSIECRLVESFDWDTILVLGDSSFSENRKLLTTLTLNLRQNRDKVQKLHIQMDYEHLNDFIQQIEEALVRSAR